MNASDNTFGFGSGSVSTLSAAKSKGGKLSHYFMRRRVNKSRSTDIGAKATASKVQVQLPQEVQDEQETKNTTAVDVDSKAATAILSNRSPPNIDIDHVQRAHTQQLKRESGTDSNYMGGVHEAAQVQDDHYIHDNEQEGKKEYDKRQGREGKTFSEGENVNVESPKLMVAFTTSRLGLSQRQGGADWFEQGLLSQPMRRIPSNEGKEVHEDEEAWNGKGKSFSMEKSPRTSRNIVSKHTQKGLISQNSLKRIIKEENDEAVERVVKTMKSQHRAEGEIRVARRGLLSRNSIIVMGGNGLNSATHTNEMLRDVSDQEKKEDCYDYVSKADFRKSMKGLVKQHTMRRLPQVEPLTISTSTSTPLDDDEKHEDADTKAKGKLTLSSNEIQQQSKKPKHDVLTEAQIFLGISMLVYMYSNLREKCRMGHTRCSMREIDTHSVQSYYHEGGVARYLDTNTKTAGSIIRVVIDELEDSQEDDAENEIVGGESKDFERQQIALFRKWIDDSRISHMDEETENMLREMRRIVARHRWKRAISAIRLSYRISGGKPPKWEHDAVESDFSSDTCNRFVDMNELMSDALRAQPKYFKEGSVMNNLIESGIEVVWFSDLSQNDVVYGICVNREEKKITIVFRGTVNAHNWAMNFKFDTNEYRNPIRSDYPGRKDELSLHSGFALYLLRKRKDTGMSKMDEIFEKVEQIGRELAPNGDYKLYITGHSMGGALATLCGFYCGAKSRFAHLSTIYIWTFAAPRVGTQAFMHAYQHLERTGRIRHARFSCTNDIVPLIPFCNFEYDDLQFYKHVGMRIQLHNSGRFGKWRLRNSLDVTYSLKHDWLSQMERAIMNSLCFNLNTPKGIKECHDLTEHQTRLHFAMMYRKALGSSTLSSDRKRRQIKTLDEYYLIRADMPTEGISEEIVNIYKVEKAKKKEKEEVVNLLMLFLEVPCQWWSTVAVATWKLLAHQPPPLLDTHAEVNDDNSDDGGCGCW